MAPERTYAWQNDDVLQHRTTSSLQMMPALMAQVGSKWGVLMFRLFVVTTFTAVMCILGVLEASVMESQSKAFLRATHDSLCYVHVFPYDDQGQELTFFTALSHWQGGNVDLLGASNSQSSTGRRSSFYYGSQQSLKSQHCNLLIRPSDGYNVSDRLNHGIGTITFYSIVDPDGDPISTRPLAFDSCDAPEGGKPVEFEEVKKKYSMTGLTLWALAVWLSLRMLQIARDVNCLSHDARYPPSTKDPSQGVCICWPFSVLLKKVAGGDRFMFWNIYRTGMRPYVMYGVLLAIIFKPVTTLHLHQECPQLIMHKGDLPVTIAAMILGTVVVSVGLMNWCIDIYYWSKLKSWSERFDEDTGCEHSHHWQGVVANFFCFNVLVLGLVMMIRAGTFVLEVRWVFTISWPNYTESRWSHALRLLALILWMVDTCSFILKFVAKGQKLDEMQKLKASGYTVQEMKERGITAIEMKEAGYDPAALRDAGYTAIEMKEAGYEGEVMVKLGFTPKQLCAAEYDAHPLKEAGYTASQLKEAGYTAVEAKDAGYTPKQLVHAGYSASDMKALKIKVVNMKALGFTPADMHDADFQALELKFAGYTATELRGGGYKAIDMREAGFGALELKDAGFTAAEMREARYRPEEMKDFGFTGGELKDAGFTALDLKYAGFGAADLDDAGYTPKEMATAGFSAMELSPKAVRLKPKKMKDLGYTAVDLRSAGYTAAELKGAHFTAAEMRKAGYPAEDMRLAGFNAQDLKAAGYTAADLRDAGCAPLELKTGGYTAADLWAAGHTPKEMKAGGYTVLELKDLGFTAQQMKAAGYEAWEIQAAGFAITRRRSPSPAPRARIEH